MLPRFLRDFSSRRFLCENFERGVSELVSFGIRAQRGSFALAFDIVANHVSVFEISIFWQEMKTQTVRESDESEKKFNVKTSPHSHTICQLFCFRRVTISSATGRKSFNSKRTFDFWAWVRRGGVDEMKGRELAGFISDGICIHYLQVSTTAQTFLSGLSNANNSTAFRAFDQSFDFSSLKRQLIYISRNPLTCFCRLLSGALFACTAP